LQALTKRSEHVIQTTTARNLLNNPLLSQWKCDVFIHFPTSRSCWDKCFTVTCSHKTILTFTASSFVKWYSVNNDLIKFEQCKLNCYGEITKVCTDLMYQYICITDRHTQNICIDAILIQQNWPRCQTPAPGVYIIIEQYKGVTLSRTNQFAADHIATETLHQFHVPCPYNDVITFFQQSTDSDHKLLRQKMRLHARYCYGSEHNTTWHNVAWRIVGVSQRNTMVGETTSHWKWKQ
jgi:hypothetical protein